MSLFMFSLVAQAAFLSDLRTFRKLLEDNHPGLYEYTSKHQFDTYFVDAEQAILKHPKDLKVLMTTLGGLVEKIGCGHTSISAPPSLMQQIVSHQHFFPLPAMVNNGELFVLEEANNLSMQVLTINGTSAKDILSKIYTLASSDARALPLKNYHIENKFFLYLHMLGLGAENYTLTWLDSSGALKTSTHPGRGFQSVAQAVNQVQHQKYGLSNGKTYGVEHLDGYSVLTTRSFAHEGEEEMQYRKFLESTFTYIRDKNVDKLVIDVRGNEGGARTLGVELFSYIASQPFAQRKITRINSHEPTEEYLVDPPVAYYDQIKTLLKRRYQESLEMNRDHIAELMKAKEHKFTGKVVVLMDHVTYSAGAEFSLLAKEDPKILVVGQESGGNCAQHNGDLALTYELPLSQVQLEIPYVHVVHVQTHCPNNTDGIKPDVTHIPTPFGKQALSKEKVLELFKLAKD